MAPNRPPTIWSGSISQLGQKARSPARPGRVNAGERTSRTRPRLLAAQRRLRWCFRSSGCDRERDPGRVAFRPVLHGNIFVCFQIQVALMLLANWEKKPDLRPDTDGASLEVAELCARAGVASELLKEIAGEPHMHIFAYELRCAPIDMKVDAVLVLQVRVDEIVGQAPRDGKFVSGLGIEIGVAGAGIHGHKT